MTDASWTILRSTLVAKYDDFRRRLARRLGSDDLAKETLHETYLQLSRTDTPIAVQRPESYLFRVALNIAAGQRRAAARRASHVEIEAAFTLADELADSDRKVVARFDIELLENAIEELPKRQRTIFLAARVQELPIQVIADALGISTRSVELELKRALAYCAGRLDREVVQRFGPKPSKASYKMREGVDPNEDPS
jgi:RNA polymerase sigma factor (sigma-70 family)